MISSDSLSSAARHHLSLQIGFASAIAETIVDGTEQLMGLTLETTRVSLDLLVSSSRQLLSAKDLQDALQISSNAAQPQTDIIMNWVRQLSHIASSSQQKLVRISRAHVDESSREINTLLDEMHSSAPESARSSITLMKSVTGNAASVYDQMMKATQSAMDQVTSTVSTASTQLSALTAKFHG